MCIHMSSFAKSALDAFPGYVTECRGEIEVKGKGLMTTYFLIGSQECRVVVYDDNDNETLQESTDPISKMTAYKMNQELMYLLSLKENKECTDLESPVRTNEESNGGNDSRLSSSPDQANDRRHPKIPNDAKCNNSVTFGGCSLIMNKNCQRNPEKLTNLVDDQCKKKQKSKIVISETPVSSILKNGSQERKKNDSITAERKQCSQNIANRNSESMTLEIDKNGRSASGVCTTNNCADLVSDQVCKNNAKNRASDAVSQVQKIQVFEHSQREHSYDVKEVNTQSLHPQLQPSFPSNHNVAYFQNQKAQRNSTNNCLNQSNNKLKLQKNQRLSLEKNGLNHDVASNYANNLKNFNKFTNSLVASPSRQKLDTSPTSTRKVNFASVSKCLTSATDTNCSSVRTPIPNISKSTESADGIVLLANLKTLNKTGVMSVSDAVIPVVTYQSHLRCGTDEDRSIIISMTNMNDEMTSL